MPPAASTTPSGTGTGGRRTSRLRHDEELHPEAAVLRPTTTTPATTDAVRNHSCALGERSLAESAAAAAMHDAAIRSTDLVPVVLGVAPAEPTDGPAAAEEAELSVRLRQPLPPVAAADLRARAEMWDWSAADVPVPPDTRCAADRVSTRLLLRASEAVDLLNESAHSYVLKDSSAFRSRLITWLVADAMGCSLPDSDVALRKGKAIVTYIKGQASRVSGFQKQARAEAAKAAGSEINQSHSRAQQLLDELLDTDSPYVDAPEFVAPAAAEPSPPSELSEGEAADLADLAEAEARAEALPARLLSLRPARRLESYAKDVSDEVRTQLDEAGQLPSWDDRPPCDFIYVRQPVTAREIVDFAFGDAEERKNSLAHLAEMKAWNLCEQELEPTTPSDYPKMLVEMYHRFRAREFELVRERDTSDRALEMMHPNIEKSEHAYYQQQLHGFVDSAKDELQRSHEAQMERFDRMQRQRDQPGPSWFPRQNPYSHP